MSQHFDSIASQYDASFSNSSIGKAQRQIVWNYLEKYLPKNPLSILEINCGTGEDAIFLASKDHSVLATDASPEMIRMASQKITGYPGSKKIETAVWDLNQPFPFDNKKFDVIFSDFGGLNCLSPETLKQLSATFAGLLNEKGKLIFVVMGRFCMMETFYFLLKGRFRPAFRRRSHQPVPARLNETTVVDTWYFSPKEIETIFLPQFKFLRKKPVGSFVPPSWLENFMNRRKKLFRLLTAMDRRVSSLGFLSSLSDHYLIEFQKA